VQSALAGGAVYQDIDLLPVKDKGYLTIFTENVTSAAYPDLGQVGPGSPPECWAPGPGSQLPPERPRPSSSPPHLIPAVPGGTGSPSLLLGYARHQYAGPGPRTPGRILAPAESRAD
jgi:hypothetical protein